jgi:hypothetical protein
MCANFLLEQDATVFSVPWRWRPCVYPKLSPHTRLHAVVTNNTTVQLLSVRFSKQNTCVPGSTIILANKCFKESEISGGAEEAMKMLLAGKKNLEGILICVCVHAANKCCRWQAQSLQQYKTGRSRCTAVIIFQAPHTGGKMLLSLSVHASERWHPPPPSTFSCLARGTLTKARIYCS